MKLLKYQFKNTFIVSTICSLSLISLCTNAAPTKHVAVPPQDLAAQQLPSPQSRGILSHSTMLPVYANERSTQNQSITKSIHFDGKGDSPIIFVSPQAQSWQLTITDPNGRKVVDETSQGNPPANSVVRIGQEDFQGRQFLLQAPSVGLWTIKLSPDLTTKQSHSAPENGKPLGYLLFKGDTNYELLSHLDNNMTLQDRRVNIVAYVVDSTRTGDDRKLSLQQAPLIGTIDSAVATIMTPSQRQITVTLADDGRNGDKVAGDGIYAGPAPTNEVGVYTSQLQISGTRPDGARFSRTITDIYPVEPESVRFVKSPAQLRQIDDHQLQIGVPIAVKDQSQTFFLAAEVWGTTLDGSRKLAAWAGGLVSPVKNNDNSHLALSFDSRWLERQGLQAPFKLKSLRLHASHNHVPLAMMEQMPLQASGKLNARLSAATKSVKIAASQPITQDMLMGTAPVTKASTRAAGNKLLLVHGYCSGSAWNTSSFSNSVEFKDYNQNRTHDEFAIRIRDFGSPYDSFGVVAHSQGGAAALHLYSRYWSGLDNASGGRLIQSLGTPYQGTSLAGNLALIGEIFGVGCGTNTDLTYNGAANWLSTIPNWARAEVDYYTTSFATKWWRWDYCNIGSDLLLSDPEDGTTEQWSGQLSGAVNKGHKKGWCHTRNMRDPAQYTDSSRNASMNSRAAR